MPKISGLDLLRSFKGALDRFAVILMSGHGDIEAAAGSFKAGALDFIEKPFAAETLFASMDQAIATLAAKLAIVHAKAIIDKLSRREREVLFRIANGKLSKTIANELGISTRTVEMHRANMLTKIGVRSVAEAVRLSTLAGHGAASGQNS